MMPPWQRARRNSALGFSIGDEICSPMMATRQYVLSTRQAFYGETSRYTGKFAKSNHQLTRSNLLETDKESTCCC